MSFELTVNFYDDIWAADDAGDTRKVLTVDTGEIVSFVNVCKRQSPPGCTWVTMYIGDTWVASFERDPETREWQEVRP